MDEPTVTPVNADNTTIDPVHMPQGRPKRTAADWVRDMRMSADVNKTTVGVETDRVTPDLLLATSKKLLKVARREQEPDPKDSLEFQRFYGPAEYFAEHVLRDGNKLGRNLLWKATNRGNLDFMQAGALDKHVSDVFYDSKLAQMVDASSPLETVDASYKTTRIGEGGVADVDSAPVEMRTVQPSYFGYIDGIRCYSDDTELMTATGWKRITEITTDDKLACLINGVLEYHNPTSMHSYDYNGTMYGYEGTHISYLVTPNHRMLSRCYGLRRDGGKCSYVTKDAEHIHGTNRVVNSALHKPRVTDETQKVFHLPPVDATLKHAQVHGMPPQGASLKNVDAVDIVDFAEYMGWWLAEGSLACDEDKGHYRVTVAQDPAASRDNYLRIKALIERLPFGAHCPEPEDNQGHNLSIARKQLYCYLKQFGKCSDKFIPDWIFTAPLKAREAFRYALLHGDGRGQRHLCTMSKRLAEDFARLQFELGESVKIIHEPEKRIQNHPGIWVVYWHTRRERLLAGKTHRHKEGQYFTEQYSGKVYCPSVPGELVYCRRGVNSVGFWCYNSPERLRVGLDMYLTKHAMKGSDGKLYQRFINARTGKEELVDSVTAAKSVIASPEMMDANTKSVFALGGKTGVRIVPKSAVDYYLPRADELFSISSNMVTMPSGVKEMRLLMGCLHPMTSIIVINKKNEVELVSAKDVNGHQQRIPGTDTACSSLCFDIRNTVAKLPMSKKHFKKVILRSGRVLVTSIDHKWPVVRDNEQVLVQAKDLKPGDTVLRSSFADVPNRRTFINSKLVTRDVAFFLGMLCRSVSAPAKDRYKLVYQEPHEQSIKKAIAKLELQGTSFYTTPGEHGKDRCVGIKDTEFISWIDAHIHINDKLRSVPSVILSAHADIAASFIDGYTSDTTQVGIDSNEDIWLLNLPNSLMRDALAFLFARCGEDTLYRDAVRSDGTSLALKIVPQGDHINGMLVDTVKCVLPVVNAPIMIDIDINDNLYATGNGIITHNSKYPLQAVSIEGREAPLVRGLDEASGKDMSQLAGKYLGARFAPESGVVTAVRKDRIDVLYDNGEKGSVPLYVNFPMNAKGFLNNTPVVKAGQSFKKGDILASSNYTNDKGESALGANLRTGWLSWKGGTYEDAVVLSESAAKKLASTTMYKTTIDLDKTISLGKQNYTTWKPAEYSKEQMEQLDDDGVIKPGSVVHKGDPLILAIQTSEPSPGTLGKRLFTDVSETWDHKHDGIVTDVVRTRKGVRVYATVTAPAEVGDKLSGCYDDQTEILTESGWKRFEDLGPNDAVAVLDPATKQASFELPLVHHKYRYQGELVGYKSRNVDFLVTPNHKLVYIPRYEYEHGDLQLKKEDAAKLYNERTFIYRGMHLDTLGNARMLPDSAVTLPMPSEHMSKHAHMEAGNTINVFNVTDLARFLGLYLAEGHCAKQGTKAYWLRISQYDNVQGGAERCAEIRALLDRMGVAYTYYDHQYFMVNNKPLWNWVHVLGNSYGKHVPQEVFTSWPVEAIKVLLDWFYMGDGEKVGLRHTTRCATVSKQLADDLQILYLLTGKCSNIHIMKAVNARSRMIYRISAGNGEYTGLNGKWYIQEYDGFVYCVTVSTGIIYIRRNGLCMWNGNSYGNKGIISQVLPDDQMPTDEKGRPLELLFSPLGLISRTNASQIYEGLLGKVAEKTGKPEIVPAFSKEDLYDYTAAKLKQNHLNADENLTDPETGRIIPNVLVGRSYIYKLKHLAESKLSARGTDEYDAEGVPAGKGVDKSKRFGGLETTALVGHDAFDVIQDAKLIRGQNNSKFWRDVRTGGIPTIPGEPLVHRKFFAHLIGSGINVRRTPKGISVFTLSNDDINELAGPRELKIRDTYEAKTFRPIDGGLFGQDIFGIDGDKWAYIQLDEPMPNPVMEEPLARLLRMSTKDLEAVAAGRAEISGMKNGEDLRNRLAKIDLETEAARALNEFKEAPLSKRDAAMKRYVAIEKMRRNGIQPAQYMLDKIPVLPPIYRPVTTYNGLTMVADSNYLYAQLLDARNDLRESRDLPAEYQQQARERLYKDWKELTGLMEPEDIKLRSKHVRGLLKWALGDSPKFSAAQRKIIGSTVDTVGRGVIAPDSKLKLNQVGIPKTMAFGIMAPFVERALVQRGYTPVDAMKAVKAQTQQATDILLEVMKTHPVLMNRAPSLHKLNVMGFDPVLVAGDAIRVNPSIVSPFAADFDGDSVCGTPRITVLRKNLTKLDKKFQQFFEICLHSRGRDVYYGCNGQDEPAQDPEKGAAMIAEENKVGLTQCTATFKEIAELCGEPSRQTETVTEWDVPTGFYVDTVDPTSGNIVTAPLTKVSKHTDLTMYDCEMSSRGGFKSVVTVSEDHSLITYNGKTLQLEKTQPQKALGKCVPYIMESSGNDPERCERTISIDGVIPLSYQVGLFLGLMLGDGWVSNTNACHIACCDASLQKAIQALLKAGTFDIPMKKDACLFTYDTTNNKHRFSHNDVGRFTCYFSEAFKEALGDLIGHGAENKHIPTTCLRGSRAHLIGILMGLLATDGTVACTPGTGTRKATHKTILYHTISPELRDGVIELCKKLGIHATASLYRGPNSKHDCYAITISAVDAATCAKKHPALFRIPHEAKQAALEQMIADLDKQTESTGVTLYDIVPFPRGLLCEFSWAGVSKMYNPSMVSEWLRTGCVARPYAERIIKEMRRCKWEAYKDPVYLKKTDRSGHTPEQAKALFETWAAMVANKSIKWRTVDSVTKATSTIGWDCTVPGPYTFAMFDGTIVQDTVNIHVPVSDNARSNARNRMFPERNLISMRNRKILYKPEKEYQQGLYIATRMKQGENVRPRIFRSLDEARAARRQGLIDVDDPIIIEENSR